MDSQKKDAHGKPYGCGNWFCMICGKANPKANPLVRSTNGTSNLLTHLKLKHKEEYQKMVEADKELASTVTSRTHVDVSPATGGRPPLTTTPSTAAPGSRQTQLGFAFTRPASKRCVPYTDEQLNNQYTAAMLTRPHNRKHNEDELKLYSMLGFKPPVSRTLTSKEEAFEKQLHEKIERLLGEEGVIRADGKPLDIPIATVGFDTTPTGTKGVHIISINLHFLDRNFKPKKIMLHCGEFVLEDAVEVDGVTRGTADNPHC